MRNFHLFTLLLVLLTDSVFARFINVDTAKIVAINYYKTNTGISNPKAYLYLTKQESDSIIDFYIFNINPKGFVIISASDNEHPILSFSSETYFDTSNIKEAGINYWISKISLESHYIIKNNFQSNSKIKSEWDNLINNNYVTNRSSSVNPLLTTKWGGYNKYCPDGTPAGCVAVAMSQIMKYWNFPCRGYGSYSYFDSPYGKLSANFGNTNYSWNLMPDSIDNNSTMIQINAVSILQYQIGVSVAMIYNPSGSGAIVFGSTPSSYYSYSHYFRYDSTKIVSIYKNNYTDSWFIKELETELDSSRPIQYAGWGSLGGHSWVCDGYNNDNLFHMNWGWGGQDDGYYTVDSLNPGGQPSDFGNGLSFDDEVLIGIVPTDNYFSCFTLVPDTISDNIIDSIIPVLLNNTQEPNIINDNNIEIYPSPASNNINIKYTGENNSQLDVSIFNLLGQNLYNNVFYINSTSEIYNLNIHNYVSGVYFLNINSPNYKYNFTFIKY